MNSKEKMMTILKHTHIHSPVHATMSRYMTLLFAIACGMAVANIYFALTHYLIHCQMNLRFVIQLSVS